MSGGHYDYQFAHVDEMADLVEQGAEYHKVWDATDNWKDRLAPRPIGEAKDRLQIVNFLRS